MPAGWLDWLAQHVTLLVLVNLSLGLLGVPALSETLLIAAGVMVARGGGVPWHVIVAAVIGSAIGMASCFEIGRGSRGFIAGRLARRLAMQDALARAEAWSRRFGPWSIIVAFFTPGLRHVTAIAAGATRLEFKRFLPLVVVGACAWSSLLVAGGYVTGRERIRRAVPHEVLRLRGDAPNDGARWRV
jgi:membrane protein DedA with SNARE-associated domain